VSYTVLDPNSSVDGKTISQWTADWWTWAAQSPAGGNNPLDDQTGAFAHQRNGGPVFFLGGTNGITGNGGSAERTFHVSHGTPVLVPMLNFFDTLDPPSVEDQLVSGFLSDISSVFATIDGHAIADPRGYLETTDFFSMGSAKPNSLINQLAKTALGQDIAHTDLSPTKATGFYLMVEFTPGVHTIDFGGQHTSGISTHVIDHIVVS